MLIYLSKFGWFDASCAPAKFHAQYSAVGKVYRYRIWNDPIFHPLEVGRSWHVPQPLDLEILRAASERLTGTHDFASFAANRGKPPVTTTRTIHQIRVRQQKELVVLEFDGNGFLYRMVRMLTGTIVRIASRRAEYSWITELLNRSGKNQDKQHRPSRRTLPGQGEISLRKESGVAGVQELQNLGMRRMNSKVIETDGACGLARSEHRSRSPILQLLNSCNS